MYNNTCVSFPRLSKLSESRKKAIKARLQTYSVEDFQRMFEMAEGSSFLKGANNRNWSATFDWMVSIFREATAQGIKNALRGHAPRVGARLPGKDPIADAFAKKAR